MKHLSEVEPKGNNSLAITTAFLRQGEHLCRERASDMGIGKPFAFVSQWCVSEVAEVQQQDL